MNAERILPCNLEAERWFLACLLFDNKNITAYPLDPSEFYNSLNGSIYEAITILSKKKKVTLELLLTGLKPTQKLFEHCAELDLDCAHDGNVKYYYGLIKNAYGRRRQIELAYKIFNDAHKENADTESTIDELKQVIEKSKVIDETGIVQASELFADIDNLYEKGLQPGLSTGWLHFDKYYTVKPGQITVITGIPSHGKALDIKTAIPTIDGFKTMEEIHTRDILFDENGNVCNVINCTEIMYGRPCYELEFSDGTKIVCDEDHLWFTRTDKARRSRNMAKIKDRLIPRQLKPRGTDQTSKRTFPKSITTKEIFNTLYAENGDRFNHCIPVIEETQTNERELPLNPYILGAWLGDGCSNSPSVTCAYKDKQIIGEIEREGMPTHENKSSNINTGLFYLGNKGRHSRGVNSKSPTILLRKIGVLGNKHVPESYLFASAEQRLALLQGLMDTDGHITDYGRCEFTNTNKILADGVFALIASLGMIPKLITGRATIYGKDCGIKYRITFTPHLPVFRLNRKLQFVKLNKRKRLGHRRIVGCKMVESIPVKCIEVDSPSKLFAVTNAFILTHNSTWNTNLVTNMAKKHYWKFAVFSPENYPMQRYCAHIAQIYGEKPFGRGNNERISPAELEPIKYWIDEHFVFIVPRSDEMRIDNLIQKATICVLKHGVKGIVFDPWNEIDHTRPPGLSETEYISKCLSKLRYFARTYDVHVWLIAHPTKMLKRQDGSYPVPTPYDISGCYSDDTEVLTDKGWLLHEKIKEGDKICCFDTAENNLSYLDFSKKWEYDYQGNMINLNSPSFDLLITPNHRVVVKPDWRDKPSFKSKVKWNGIGRPATHKLSGWSFVEADKLKSDLRMPFSTRLIDCPDHPIADNDLKIMGWWITEGWESMGSIAFCQAIGDLAKKMLETVKAAGYIFTLKINKSKIISEKPMQVIRFKNRYCEKTKEFTKMILNQCGIGCQNKKLPLFVWKLSFRQKQILFKALMEGDGSKGRGDSFRFATTSAILVNDIQRLSVEMGRMASFSSQSGACEHHKRRYQINIGQTKRNTITLNMQRHKSMIQYSGKVYCLTVPTGAYVSRRNGKVSICGNSAHFRNKADNCLTVWRDLNDPGSNTKIFIQKVRFHEVGKIGEAEFHYKIPTQSYDVVVQHA